MTSTKATPHPWKPIATPAEDESNKGLNEKICGRDARAPIISKGWHSRGYLPHVDVGGLYQGITYRLSDSLPMSAGVPPAVTPQSHAEKAERRKQIEQELNKGYGSCLLRHKEIAQIVVDAWLYFDGKRYDLVAYVVMPNHVHVLIKTYEGFPLSKVIHSWKSFTAHEIIKCLKRGVLAGGTPALPGHPSKLWQNEYFDRFIRDDRHFAQAIDYIHENPVKAGLCRHASEWPWSSVGK
ncbi:transposase [Desulfoluna sp.]|uniref:REP-associated tyrosine transposase n=1 Tax=Desulfoluna sp. TaxID=2045199 RepID=UPI00261EF0D6|nr:transposase [Desulfoluna sp.]